MTVMRENAYLQPHEGVQGMELGEGHLLALDEASIRRRIEVINRVKERWDDILYGQVADRDAAFKRMYNPRVGDMVMELTTSFRSDRESQVQGFGILLVYKRREWACTDEEWALHVAREKEEHEKLGLSFDAGAYGRNRFPDTVSYLQYGPDPGDICRWSNCTFIAVTADVL